MNEGQAGGAVTTVRRSVIVCLSMADNRRRYRDVWGPI
jgi:hypothetical protein